MHLQPQDIDSLAEFFNGAYYCSKEAIRDAVERQSIFNIIDHTSGFKADFVIRKNNTYRLAEFARRKKMNFYGTEIYVVSVEDLLISKLIWIQQWQAAVQIEDIKNLLLLPDLDSGYMRQWIAELNLNTFNLMP